MRVLLVDPDSTLLPSVQAALTAIEGIEIYCAPDASTALQHAHALGGVDVLITDAFLPDSDGFQLRNAIAALAPQLGTVYLTKYDLSGYSEYVGGSPVVAVPVDHAALLEAVKSSLGSPPHTGLNPPANSGPELAHQTQLNEGMTLGDYRLLRTDQRHEWGTQFAAVQMTLNRPVSMSVLSPEQARNQSLRAAFLADAGAKSRIQHPAILTVYEAGEKDGWVFYTSERIESQTLNWFRNSQQKLSVDIIIRTARFIASGLHHLSSINVPHLLLQPSHILLPADGHARLSNLVVADPTEIHEVSRQIESLGEIILAVMPQSSPASLRVLLARTQKGHQKPIGSWDEFLGEIESVEMEWDSPVPTASAQTPRRGMPAIGATAALILAAAGAVGFFLMQSTSKPPLPEQILIPSGNYLIGAGKPVQMQSFSVDKTEVTRGQYAVFADWLEKHPSQAGKFDHPAQPKGLSHLPPTLKKEAAEKNTPPQNKKPSPDDLLPAAEISWWDAYAFANWAGRSLPTAEQWEAAARGSKGLIYPWGDEPEQNTANTKPSTANKDHAPSSSAAADQKDVSPFGLLGMAGNVSEWTSNEGPNATKMIKGGNYLAPLSSLESSSTSAPDKKLKTLGFRTVSKSPQ
jgi:formylglycine-generating enzyme required for sulfatase activity/DNA-binding response OmpR family regulator